MGKPDTGEQVALGLRVDQLADLIWHIIGIGAWRIVSLAAPGVVGLHGLAAYELQGLGAGLIAQGLTLEMNSDSKDLQITLFGNLKAFPGVGLGSGVVVAAAEVELPAGFFPAVEAGVGNELDPSVHRHGTELATNQADLVIR